PKGQSVAAPSEEPGRAVAPQRSRVVAALRWLFGGAFVLVLATLVAWGGRHFATTSERFGFDTLVISGATRFSEAELIRLLGVSKGDNLFALDMEAAERHLLEHPWVASAALRRKLPSTLELDIVE